MIAFINQLLPYFFCFFLGVKFAVGIPVKAVFSQDDPYIFEGAK